MTEVFASSLLWLSKTSFFSTLSLGRCLLYCRLLGFHFLLGANLSRTESYNPAFSLYFLHISSRQKVFYFRLATTRRKSFSILKFLLEIRVATLKLTKLHWLNLQRSLMLLIPHGVTQLPAAFERRVPVQSPLRHHGFGARAISWAVPIAGSFSSSPWIEPEASGRSLQPPWWQGALAGYLPSRCDTKYTVDSESYRDCL